LIHAALLGGQAVLGVIATRQDYDDHNGTLALEILSQLQAVVIRQLDIHEGQLGIALAELFTRIPSAAGLLQRQAGKMALQDVPQDLTKRLSSTIKVLNLLASLDNFSFR
jgi:hypothetical protein